MPTMPEARILIAQGGAFGINGAAMGVPRMYGAQATYDF